MPALPAPGGLARAGGARPPGGLRRRGLLGPARARLRRSRRARLVVVGLAPAAHGGNRTGRVFTGDRSGDWLFGRCGGPATPTSPRARPATTASTLHGRLRHRRRAGAPRRTTSRPPTSATRAVPFLAPRARAADATRRVLVALGPVRLQAVARPCSALRPRPRFGHLAEHALADGRTAAVLVPPEPAEHLHGDAHRADVRRRVRRAAAALLGRERPGLDDRG